MNFKNISTDRFQLNIMNPDLVSNIYLNWLKDKQTSKFIINKNYTLLELKNYCIDKMNSENCIFWGIFYNTRHIGNIKFEPIDFIKKFAIMGVLIGDKEWQGKGVFKEIFQQTSKELYSLGINKIYLGVDTNNFNAISSYIKTGFKIIETKDNTHKMLFEF